jgi:sugar phosphate isomerase/epimerase
LVERIPWTDLVPHLALVQLGDSKSPPSDEPNRCRLGEGELPLPQLIQQLCDQGYRGYYDVELMGVDVENQPYEGLIEHSLDYFRSLESRVNH